MAKINLKNFVLFCFILFISISWSFAQELTDKLPQDPKVIVGTLNNGMKYYIRSNKFPENRGEFSIVVNAGSVLEDEDQQGLAHFVEHMAFNGTKNFPKNALVKYLESLGMKFGAEVNAYTSFDQTVYGITVPTDSADKVENGLLVLYDWASQILFEQEEVVAERGVIHEEWRLSQGAEHRIQEIVLKAAFKDSKYAERSPIGKMEIVDNAQAETLLRFYKDWYRPDLMAVVIVGDFDAKDMENKVKNLFGKIKKVENPRERPFFTIPNNEKPIVAVASDKELSQAAIQIYYKHPQEITTTVAGYRNDIMENMLSSMLSSRLSELTISDDPPFPYAMGGVSDFIGPIKVFMNVSMLQKNDYTKALNALIAENLRMVQHGFTQTELDREKNSTLKGYEKMFNEKDKTKSTNYLHEYQRNYLYPYEPFPGIEYEYELAKKHVPTITLEEINALAKTLINNNAIVLLVMPEKEGVKVPTNEELTEIYNNAFKQTVTPYIDKVSDKPFIAKLPAKGKVAKTIKNKDIDTETWILKNGIKIVLKPTNFKDDEILMLAKSNGGSSLCDQKDVISAKIACDVAEESGMGDYDKIEFDKFISDKQISFNPYIGEISEGIYANSTISDFETLLQLIYVHFTKPKVSESAFNSYINKMKPLLEDQSLSPESVWQDSIGWIFSNRNPRRRALTPEILNEASFKRVKSIYENRFSDPKNFTFYFVGNLDLKKIKPLIEQYLGALQGVERTETYKDLGIRPPKGQVEKRVEKGIDAKCIEMIMFPGEVEYNQKNDIIVDALSKLLTQKLLEEIREKESGVYSISAYPQVSAKPYESYLIRIWFSCDPEREAELFEKIGKIINDLKAGTNFSEEDIAKTKEKLKREFEVQVKENSFWRNTLVDIEDGIYTVNDYKNYLKDVEQVNQETMKAAAKKFLDLNNYIKIYLFPGK